ncbi:MAG TPA: sulfotransferase, partial [Chloroflexota bacterium]
MQKHETMDDRTVVCVLGMHRSGTSLVTRLLNILGVYLGADSHLIQARMDNPKGFWEHRGIQRLNDEILGRLGGSWAEMPAFRPGWECAPGIEDLRQRGRRIVNEDFRDASIWGWKDPTTSVTLPFWQQLLPRMRYVICLRHPIDSARSLQRRDGLSLEEGIDLWIKHVNLALQHTSGGDRLLVFYEDVIDDWRPVVRELAHFLGHPERGEDADVQRAVEAFIDGDLHHHRTSAADGVTLDLPNAVIASARQAYDH